MFGAYIADPNSPESLEKKKAENKEQPLSEQQQETYNKWTETMGDVAENGAAPGATQETEPTITEDEPGLQGDALSDMTLPTDDVAQEATDLPTDDTLATTETAPAEATPAEATPAEAVAPAETTADDSADSAISHFAKTDDEPSGFNPVPVEEQRDAKIAAEAAHAKTYSGPGESTNSVVDGDNLVATEVGNNLNGDLNDAGEKLEHEGVDIGQEVDSLQTDISNDMAEATTAGNPDNMAHDAVTANNLAVEAGSTALAAKEAAGEAVDAVKSGDDAMAAIERANALADQATELAGLSEEVSAAAGTTGAAEATAGAREMAEEAKDIADKAEAAAKDADAKDAEGDGKKEEESDEGKTVFSKDDYPELNELQPDPIDGGPITG